MRSQDLLGAGDNPSDLGDRCASEILGVGEQFVELGPIGNQGRINGKAFDKVRLLAPSPVECRRHCVLLHQFVRRLTPQPTVDSGGEDAGRGQERKVPAQLGLDNGRKHAELVEASALSGSNVGGHETRPAASPTVTEQLTSPSFH